MAKINEQGAIPERINKLKNSYETACHAYIDEFCKKQEIDFDFWVADIIGGICVLGDFSFNFNDIVYDINSNQPKGAIFGWYEDNLKRPGKSINYFSYTKGIRVTDLI